MVFMERDGARGLELMLEQIIPGLICPSCRQLLKRDLQNNNRIGLGINTLYIPPELDM